MGLVEGKYTYTGLYFWLNESVLALLSNYYTGNILVLSYTESYLLG